MLGLQSVIRALWSCPFSVFPRTFWHFRYCDTLSFKHSWRRTQVIEYSGTRLQPSESPWGKFLFELSLNGLMPKPYSLVPSLPLWHLAPEQSTSCAVMWVYSDHSWMESLVLMTSCESSPKAQLYLERQWLHMALAIPHCSKFYPVALPSCLELARWLLYSLDAHLHSLDLAV